MTDRERLQRKLAEQKARNIIKKIRSVQIIGQETCALPDHALLEKLGFYSQDKKPDSAIPESADLQEIIDRMLSLLNDESGEIFFLLIYGVIYKVRFTDRAAALRELWTAPEAGRYICLLNEDKTVLYEFGSDSRDEDNYLFDKYQL